MEGLFIIRIASVLRVIPGALGRKKPFEGKNFNPLLHPRLLCDLGQIFLSSFSRMVRLRSETGLALGVKLTILG